MSSGLVFLLFSTALVVGHCAHLPHGYPAFAPSMPVRQATVLPKSMLHPIFQTQLQKQAPGLTLELQASFKGYHDRIVKDKTGRLEKLSRHIFNLQDTLMQIAIAKELQEIAIAGPAEPSPNHTAVVGTGPAGRATAIMLARYVFGLFFPNHQRAQYDSINNRRGWSNIVLYDRLPAPPRSDSGEFGDPEVRCRLFVVAAVHF